MQISINTTTEKRSLIEKLRQIFLVEKLKNPIGLTLLLLAGAFFSLVVAKSGIVYGALIIALLVALPILYSIIAFPIFGIMVLVVAAYLIMYVIKFNFNFPLGTLIDALEVLLIFGFFLKQKYHPNWKMFHNPVSGMILLYVLYNILQVINPWADSQMAWLYTVRSVAFVMLMYFVFLYGITSISQIRMILLLWLGLALLAAVYAIKQEYLGLSTAEYRTLANEPGRIALYFINGRWRIFSIFNDPVVFAYNMVLATLLCFALAWGPTKNWQKVILISLACLFMTVMLYSGTRGAYVLIPAGLAMFCILTYTRKILVLALIAAAAFLMLVLLPSSNPNIMRFQSAFKPGKDASYQVRQINQAKIKPFIQTHAMGGGLGSVGIWGQRFSPDSELAHFPPDSGYVRVAVETGWIGLLILCGLVFTVLYTGINIFFKLKNKELKTYCLAMITMIFAISVGNYPQEAIVQYPSSVLFYLMIAILMKCLELDKNPDTGKLIES